MTIDAWMVSPVAAVLVVAWASGAAADCCVDGGDSPTCELDACVACVCEFEAECCDPGATWALGCIEVAKDAVCEAACECVPPAPLPAIQCCSGSGGPGCGDPACESCVCDEHPECCDAFWDLQCTNEALGSCATQCGCAQPGGTALPFPSLCTGASVGDGVDCEPHPVGADTSTPTCLSTDNWDFDLCFESVVPPEIVIFVDDSAPGPGIGTVVDPFVTIEDGILAANPGDTVCVAKGTYPEIALIEKPLRLIGACANQSVIAEGGIRIVGTQDVEVQQLTVQGSMIGGLSVVNSQFVLAKNLISQSNEPANFLVHESPAFGFSPTNPSPCGGGPTRNLDICQSSLLNGPGSSHGFRASVVDDVRMASVLISDNGGAGVLTDGDAFRIRGSRIERNAVGVVLRNPVETIVAENNDILSNTVGGLVVLRSEVTASPQTVRVESNVHERNGGIAVGLLDVITPPGSPSALASEFIVKRNVVDSHRKVGIAAVGARVEIVNNIVSRVRPESGKSALDSGRGIEVQGLHGASVISDNDVLDNSSVGVLLIMQPAGVAVGDETMTVTTNTITDNGVYGFYAGTSPPAIPTTCTAATCPEIDVVSNALEGNAGAGVYGATPEAVFTVSGSTLTDTVLLTEPAGTFNYSVVVDNAQFFLTSNDSAFTPADPTAHFLVEGAQEGSAVTGNTFSEPLPIDAPQLAVNDDSITVPGLIGSPIALPMPCPMIPTPMSAEVLLFEGL